ncbi:MAG: hypothetical protein KME31_14970 [Tolypothrix carrinoi HA7290-LM1]|nr:hypothetical protein [Tolypothrix carrinoi HA7290-LM1]
MGMGHRAWKESLPNPILNAQFSIFNAHCPMPIAQCPLPHAQCPIPNFL